LARLAAAAPRRRSWRFPLWAALQHARLGGAMALAAGCDRGAADLIRAHQDGAGLALAPPLIEMLAALRAADEELEGGHDGR
jgi:hypothetical protein